MSIKDYHTAVLECTTEDKEVYSNTKRGDVVLRGTVPDQKVHVNGSLVACVDGVKVEEPVKFKGNEIITNRPQTLGPYFGSLSMTEGQYKKVSEEKDVTPEQAFNMLNDIEIHKYTNGQIGCSGEQVKNIYPKCVYKDDESGHHMIDYSKLVPLLILALRVFNDS